MPPRGARPRAPFRAAAPRSAIICSHGGSGVRRVPGRDSRRQPLGSVAGGDRDRRALSDRGPTVAAAIAGDKLPYRIATGLPRNEAQAIVDALAPSGAVTTIGEPNSLAPDRLTPPVHQGAQAGKDGRITLKSSGNTRALDIVDVADLMETASGPPTAVTANRGPDIVRCPIHGLSYDRRRSSGCARCLGSARAQARQFQESGAIPVRTGSRLRDNPVRRAFLGLVVALALGFLPAVYYARVVQRGRLDALRAEQATLTAAPASPESLARFDALDAQVASSFRQGATRTLLLWVALAGVAGVVWWRAT